MPGRLLFACANPHLLLAKLSCSRDVAAKAGAKEWGSSNCTRTSSSQQKQVSLPQLYLWGRRQQKVSFSSLHHLVAQTCSVPALQPRRCSRSRRAWPEGRSGTLVSCRSKRWRRVAAWGWVPGQQEWDEWFPRLRKRGSRQGSQEKMHGEEGRKKQGMRSACPARLPQLPETLLSSHSELFKLHWPPPAVIPFIQEAEISTVPFPSHTHTPKAIKWSLSISSNSFLLSTLARLLHRHPSPYGLAL